MAIKLLDFLLLVYCAYTNPPAYHLINSVIASFLGFCQICNYDHPLITQSYFFNKPVLLPPKSVQLTPTLYSEN